jgi:hypothetical protein
LPALSGPRAKPWLHNHLGAWPAPQRQNADTDESGHREHPIHSLKSRRPQWQRRLGRHLRTGDTPVATGGPRTRSPSLRVSLSPRLRVSLSPRLRVSLSPRLRVSASPRLSWTHPRAPEWGTAPARSATLRRTRCPFGTSLRGLPARSVQAACGRRSRCTFKSLQLRQLRHC